MIGVIGGTGITGSQLVAALQARAAEFRCIVRDPDAAKAKLGHDVELVRGDLSDTSSLESAMTGFDTLYILCGHSPMLQQLEINALEAAKEAGVSYIVYASGSEKGIRPDSPSKVMQMHYHVEEAIKSSGIDWAVSRPNYFMSTLMSMAEPVKKMGKLITSLPKETGISMIHPTDIGEAAAEIILNKDRAGQAYFLTGPVITMGQVVEEVSKAVGKSIEYVQVPPEAAEKAMADKGMPDWLVAHVSGMMGIVAKGDMDGVTDWVEQLTGHPPRTLDQWLDGAKGAFGG